MDALVVEMDTLVDEINETTRELGRVRERVTALIDRERDIRDRLEACARTA